MSIDLTTLRLLKVRERYDRLMRLQQGISLEQNQAWVGRELRIAIRKVAGGRFSTWANDTLQPGATLDVHLYWHYWVRESEPARRLTEAVKAAARVHLHQDAEDDADSSVP